MRRKIIKTSVWVTIGLLGLVLLGTGGALWRLAMSPLQVSFLLPYLQSSLVDPASGYTLEIDSAAVTWDRRDHSLLIQAGQSALRRADGPLILDAPSTSIRLDFLALLTGEVRPSRVAVDGVRLVLDVDETGGIGIGSGAATTPEIWAALDHILAPEGPASPFRYLESLVVRDGHVTVSDRRRPAPWSADIQAMQINKEDARLDGTAALSFRPDGQAEPVEMHARLYLTADAVSGEVTFRNFNATHMSDVLPDAKPLHGLDAPLTGTLALDIDRGGGTQHLRFDLEGGQGGSFSGPALAKPLPLQSASLSGQVDLASGAVRIETARIETPLSGKDPTRLTFAGLISPRDTDTAIDGEMSVEGLSVADLKAYWPAGDGSAVRAWLDENVDRGLIERATIAVNLAGGSDGLAVRSITGSLAYRDVAIRVSPDVPLLIVHEGTADIAKETIRVALPQADLGPLSFAATTADIGGLPAGPLRADVQTRFAATITDTLAVAERLGGPQASQLPFPADDLGGRLTADVRIAFPLGEPVSLQTAEVDARGTISEASVRKAILDKDITGADLSYRFDGTTLDVSGPLTFAGVPVSVEARQTMNPSGAGETRFEARLPEITPQFWAGFGIAVEPTLEGHHSAVVTGTIGPDKGIELAADIDLRRAVITLPILNWTKPSGAPGTMRSTVNIGNDDTAVVEAFTVTAGDLSANGSARIAFNGAADITATVADFKLQRSHLRNIAMRARGESLAMRVAEGVLDLTGEKIETPGAALDDLPFTDFDIEVPGLQRVYFAEDRYMENVAVRLIRKGGRWDFAQITAAVPGTDGPNRNLLLNYGRAESGDMSLRVQAADLGATMKALDISDGVRRGELDLAGTRSRSDSDGPIKGRFKVTNFIVKDTPVLAQILAAGSLTDFRRLFEGEGIAFADMTGDSSLTEEAVTVQRMRAVGGSLAITANGTYDLASDRVAFKGHAVPARRINELISKIPVLGSVLTGANKEGIVAVGFTVDGKAGDPKVSVNPGSVLTPGILRDIFGGILN